jgi:CHRD domain
MRLQRTVVFGGVIAMLLGSAAFADEFRARLGRVPVDSRTQSEIVGLGHAMAELDGNRLTIEGDFGGLGGAATAARIYMGAALGARGPAIGSLNVESAREGALTGSIDLSPEQIAALRAGRLYIQIDSEVAPDGNLWGWLLSD